MRAHADADDAHLADTVVAISPAALFGSTAVRINSIVRVVAAQDGEREIGLAVVRDVLDDVDVDVGVGDGPQDHVGDAGLSATPSG
jgi:hypothetical protein